MIATPVDGHLHEVQELDNFVNAALEGLAYVSVAHDVLDVLRESPAHGGPPSRYSDGSIYEQVKEHYSKLRSFAEEQFALGTPFVYQLAVVRLWSILEAACDSLILKIVKDPVDLPSHQGLTRIRVGWLEFATATEEDRAELVRGELLRLVDAPLKIGIGRFEGPLELLGLGGAIDEGVKRALYELGEVRNAIVHRASVRDRKLNERCPWLEGELNEEVPIGRTHYLLYSLATTAYLLDLAIRWVQKSPDDQTWARRIGQTRDVLVRQISEFWSSRGTPG